MYRLFSKRDQKKLYAIDEALLKVQHGEYGSCEECGEAIGEKRLRAIPFARLCFDCQSSEEINYSDENDDEDYSDLAVENDDSM